MISRINEMTVSRRRGWRGWERRGKIKMWVRTDRTRRSCCISQPLRHLEDFLSLHSNRGREERRTSQWLGDGVCGREWMWRMETQTHTHTHIYTIQQQAINFSVPMSSADWACVEHVHSHYTSSDIIGKTHSIIPNYSKSECHTQKKKALFHPRKQNKIYIYFNSFLLSEMRAIVTPANSQLQCFGWLQHQNIGGKNK